ncbi:hypothetical protein [Mesorhizobium neociceri]|uniref:Uncharacterized protein n=1 Tax=Mesorhizobium neociceri TaxID=1307853 RepID=A0A838B493_9HYPH|nr:hypothetical protein [Mesorhizobium neociceri]MBA1140594.1 hypothetical protein [Mesorhizobium neociceri]
MTKARKRNSGGEHVYLKDRMDSWSAGLELAFLLCALGLALLAAAYSPDGFWQGLWEALIQFWNNRA